MQVESIKRNKCNNSLTNDMENSSLSANWECMHPCRSFNNSPMANMHTCSVEYLSALARNYGPSAYLAVDNKNHIMLLSYYAFMPCLQCNVTYNSLIRSLLLYLFNLVI